MRKKVLIASIGLFLCLMFGLGYLASEQDIIAPDEENAETQEDDTTTEEVITIGEGTQSMMILIEYKDTIGLENFVSEMDKRNVTGLLLVSPDFVEQNCEVMQEVVKHDIEIIGSNPRGVFWDVPYEEQYEIISDMKTRI